MPVFEGSECILQALGLYGPIGLYGFTPHKHY